MRILIKSSLFVFYIVILLFVANTSLKLLKYNYVPFAWTWATEATPVDSERHLYRLDPTRIYRHSNSVLFDDEWGTDENGFRYSPAHKSNENIGQPIIMVGDSMTYGHGVKHTETFSAQLENMLIQNGIPVHVYNAGVNGYGPDEEYIYIRDVIVKRFHPKIIVWNFTQNDLFDVNTLCLFTEKNGAYIQIPGWLNTVYIQGVIAKYIPEFIAKSKIVNLIARIPNALSHTDPATIGCTSQPSRSESLSKINNFVSDIAKILKKSDTKLLITMTPLQQYFEDNFENNDYAAFVASLKKNDVPFINLNEKISGLFTGNEVPVFPINPETTDSAETGNKQNLSEYLFLKTDTQFPFGNRHLNSIGHYYTAIALYEYLKTIL